MTTLIAPVGQQPTPNLIPLYTQPETERFDRIQFLVSDNERFKERFEHLRRAIAQDSYLKSVTVLEPCPMNAWDLETARRDCEAAIRRGQEQDTRVVVNLTGGTKIMSLGAYQAARNTRVPMLYVNTEWQEIIYFDTEGRAAEHRFRVRIPIETQLRAAGREIRRNPDGSPTYLRPEDVDTRRAEFACHLVEQYRSAYENLVSKLLPRLRKTEKGSRVASVPVTNRAQETARLGHDLGIWTWDEATDNFTIPDEDRFLFLNGGWVEVFALVILNESGNFDEVVGNLEVVGFEMEMEMDVVVSVNGSLGIVECKTKANKGKSFIAAKLGIHQVLLGGPYAATLFAFADKENFRDWKQACLQYGLPEPVFGEDVGRLANELSKRLSQDQ